MSGPGAGFVRLLEAPDAIEADLARELLGSSGIPSMLHGQDRDFAELGQAIHMRVSRPDLYVPSQHFERARALLAEAWDAGSLTDSMAEEQPSEDPLPPTAPVLSRTVIRFVFVAIVVVALAYTVMRAARPA